MRVGARRRLSITYSLGRCLAHKIMNRPGQPRALVWRQKYRGQVLVGYLSGGPDSDRAGREAKHPGPFNNGGCIPPGKGTRAVEQELEAAHRDPGTAAGRDLAEQGRELRPQACICLVRGHRGRVAARAHRCPQ